MPLQGRGGHRDDAVPPRATGGRTDLSRLGQMRVLDTHPRRLKHECEDGSGWTSAFPNPCLARGPTRGMRRVRACTRSAWGRMSVAAWWACWPGCRP
jgi:hypothetical protein